MNHRALLFLLAATVEQVDATATPPPTKAPTKAPSDSPSLKPSTSALPSSIPSTQPSRQPSSIPSRQPSSIPSSQPSRQPSSIPSRHPSSIPSSQPSRQPSSIPSRHPSSMPSVIPSGHPSSIPSTQPTSIPSVQPTGQPSSIPSTQPSCTPSASPTDPATSHQFYPDWSSDSMGCKNDGSEPSYMAANPTYYMSSTLTKCCTTYFQWNFDVCMGNERGVCSRALWYPDWEGSNAGCVNDGNEPKYMTDNAVAYMFMELTDCCDQYYKWDYNGCTKATALQNVGLYYPDFGGSKDICVTGGGQPTYMNNSPSIWMHETLKECCTTNYNYNLKECIESGSTGTATATAPTAPGLYYPDWLGTSMTCRNDNGQPSYMTNNPTMWMHTTAAACCKKNYSWNEDACLQLGGTTILPTGTGKFYKRSSDWQCVQDCIGSSPCGGLRKNWEKLDYTTRKTCCASIPFDEECMTRTISVSD